MAQVPLATTHKRASALFEPCCLLLLEWLPTAGKNYGHKHPKITVQTTKGITDRQDISRGNALKS